MVTISFDMKPNLVPNFLQCMAQAGANHILHISCLIIIFRGSLNERAPLGRRSCLGGACRKATRRLGWIATSKLDRSVALAW